MLTKAGDHYLLRVGISVFGTPSYFDIDNAIFEFRSFVETNNGLKLDVVLKKYQPLTLEEYHVMPRMGGCSFVDPKYLKKKTLEKLPSDVSM